MQRDVWRPRKWAGGALAVLVLAGTVTVSSCTGGGRAAGPGPTPQEMNKTMRQEMEEAYTKRKSTEGQGQSGQPSGTEGTGQPGQPSPPGPGTK